MVRPMGPKFSMRMRYTAFGRRFWILDGGGGGGGWSWMVVLVDWMDVLFDRVVLLVVDDDEDGGVVAVWLVEDVEVCAAAVVFRFRLLGGVWSR